MSWSSSYAHTLAIALDDWAASVFFNRPDLTISTMCYMAENGTLDRIKPWRWQRLVLTKLAPILNRIQKGHCELARQGDVERAKSTLELLS